jgi:hypothetical protein
LWRSDVSAKGTGHDAAVTRIKFLKILIYRTFMAMLMARHAAATAPNARLHRRSCTDYRAIAAQYHVRIANILPKYEHHLGKQWLAAFRSVAANSLQTGPARP